jgi:hypothetical protein
MSKPKPSLHGDSGTNGYGVDDYCDYYDFDDMAIIKIIMTMVIYPNS